MRASLSALREAHVKGALDEDFRSYIAMFKDGRELAMTSDEMVEMVNTKDCRDIALTFHVWVYRGDKGHYACCEVATVLGIQASWTADLDDRSPAWVNPNDTDGEMFEYFKERNHYMSEAVSSAGAEAIVEEHDLDVDPARWVANSKASDFGAN